jgi:hypothetical protein
MLRVVNVRVNNKKEKNKNYLQLSCIFDVILIKCTFDLAAILTISNFEVLDENAKQAWNDRERTGEPFTVYFVRGLDRNRLYAAFQEF